MMWSSPLLLLVLVFTLTTTSSPATRHEHGRAPSQRSSTAPIVTTTTTTTTVAPPPVKNSTTTTTPEVKSTKFVSVTVSTAKSVAPEPSASAASGVLSGVLTPSFGVADVPVQGPGLWTLTTSSPIRSRLQCASSVVAVARRVVIWTPQSCQLQLISTDPEVSPTWQLTPTR